jgi:uncharacterized small protein (DUF1192 family)
MLKGREVIELHPQFLTLQWTGVAASRPMLAVETLVAGRRCDNHGAPRYGWPKRMVVIIRSVAMDEDVPIRKKVLHEIGQDLSRLSVEELSARIELLQEEIIRLDAARSSKRATRTAADQFFKK